MITQVCLVLLGLGGFLRFVDKKPFVAGICLLFSVLVMLPMYVTLNEESAALSYWLTAFVGELSVLTLFLVAKFSLRFDSTHSQKMRFWCFVLAFSTMIQLAVVGILPAWLWMNNGFLAAVIFVFLMISLWKSDYGSMILIGFVLFIWQVNIKQQPLLSLYLTDLWLWLFSFIMAFNSIVLWGRK
jgi:hypothetical protein